MPEFMSRKLWDGDTFYYIRPRNLTDAAKMYRMSDQELLDYINTHPEIVIM